MISQFLIYKPIFVRVIASVELGLQGLPFLLRMLALPDIS